MSRLFPTQTDPFDVPAYRNDGGPEPPAGARRRRIDVKVTKHQFFSPPTTAENNNMDGGWGWCGGGSFSRLSLPSGKCHQENLGRWGGVGDIMSAASEGGKSNQTASLPGLKGPADASQ